MLLIFDRRLIAILITTTAILRIWVFYKWIDGLQDDNDVDVCFCACLFVCLSVT